MRARTDVLIQSLRLSDLTFPLILHFFHFKVYSVFIQYAFSDEWITVMAARHEQRELCNMFYKLMVFI